MPIYKGTQKVAPRPGGVTPSKVYRGSQLVWQGSPYPLTASFEGQQTGSATLLWSHTFTEAGMFEVEASPTFTGDYPYMFLHMGAAMDDGAIQYFGLGMSGRPPARVRVRAGDTLRLTLAPYIGISGASGSVTIRPVESPPIFNVGTLIGSGTLNTASWDTIAEVILPYTMRANVVGRLTWYNNGAASKTIRLQNTANIGVTTGSPGKQSTYSGWVSCIPDSDWEGIRLQGNVSSTTSNNRRYNSGELSVEEYL